MGCPAQLLTVMLCACADQQSADMRCPESGLNSIILWLNFKAKNVSYHNRKGSIKKRGRKGYDDHSKNTYLMLDSHQTIMQ